MVFQGQAGQDRFVLACLGGKHGGTFLEIGSNDAIHNSNSYVLETEYEWKGLMVDSDERHVASYKLHRKNPYIIHDPQTLDYKGLLQKCKFPLVMDYLQIHLEVENRSTLHTLEWLEKTVFPQYKFSVITFTHDIYRGNHHDTRALSRIIFEKWGYVRIFEDVMDNLCAYEDWYVHPRFISPSWIDKVTTRFSLNWNDIMKRIEEEKAIP